VQSKLSNVTWQCEAGPLSIIHHHGIALHGSELPAIAAANGTGWQLLTALKSLNVLYNLQYCHSRQGKMLNTVLGSTTYCKKAMAIISTCMISI